jgi:hypothetical protein
MVEGTTVNESDQRAEMQSWLSMIESLLFSPTWPDDIHEKNAEKLAD